MVIERYRCIEISGKRKRQRIRDREIQRNKEKQEARERKSERLTTLRLY